MDTASGGKPLAVEDLQGLEKSLEKITAEVQSFAEDVNKKLLAGEELTKAFKDNVDKALDEQGTLRIRIQELEQKAARRGGGEAKPDKEVSPGDAFINNEKVKNFCAGRDRGRVRVDMAAITTAGMPGLIEAFRVPTPYLLPMRRMTVRDLLTPGRTNSNAIQFWQQTGFTNNARVQSEGTTKGESTLAGELVTRNVSTIAHFMIAAKQVMDDAPMLASLIDGQLRYGLAFVEEDELLNGDGSGVHLFGLIPQATAYSAEFTPAMQQMIDTIRLAILQSELALFPATGIVVNPIDWARIELTKDAEGRYIFAQPQTMAQPRLWSRDLVATPAMTEDKFLTGAFRLGAQLFDREDANVELSTEDNDNFRRNLVTIRAEERLVLAVYRPECFIYGDFGQVT